MPSRDPPQPTGFPPVTSEEIARQESVEPDAVAIVRCHRARVAAASAIAPEMRRVALDILDAVLDDLRSGRDGGSRS
jgi:hypothetical protein